MSGPRLRRLTPPGRGGVALLALDGPGAATLLGPLLRRPLPSPGRVTPGLLVDATGAPLDDVLVARGGPDAFEVGCHGGPAVVERIVAALRAAGAREDLAGLGLRDAADRVAAEAEALLPRALTELGCQALLAQRSGALARAVGAAVERVEAGRHEAALALVEALLATWPLGRALLEPPRVALVGLPNAGKSSLVNALLGHERVIVSPEPGTTRDAVAELVELDGVPALLVDTAGRRDVTDPVEAAGVGRAADEAARAALRLVVLDATRAAEPAAQALARGLTAPRVVVATKVDLLDAAGRAAAQEALAALAPGGAPVLVSSVTGEGLAAVRVAARAALVGPPVDAAAPLVFTERQRGLLEGARRALTRASPERARACLGAITG